MDSIADAHKTANESDSGTAQQENNELFERERKAWLWAGSMLGGLICIAPALSSLLAMLFALALGCESISFDEQRVPLCSSGNNSQIYLLGFIGRYGWAVSLPAGVIVVLIAFISYSATERSK